MTKKGEPGANSHTPHHQIKYKDPKALVNRHVINPEVGMKLITVHVPIRMIRACNTLVQKGAFQNRSILIREAIKNTLRDHGVVVD